MLNPPEAVRPNSPAPFSRENQISPTDETIVLLASAILAGDLLTLGLVFLGVITLPFSWPAVLNGAAFIAGVSAIVIVWETMSSPASTNSVTETEEPEEELEYYYVDTTHVWGQIPDPNDDGAGIGTWGWIPEHSIGVPEEIISDQTLDELKEFKEIDGDTPDSLSKAQRASKERKAARKKDAISEWKRIKQQIETDPNKPLPLLLSNPLDLFFEALCKNRGPTVGYIEQASDEGQPNDIANYKWNSSQNYLIFCLGIEGLNSRNPLSMGSHFLGGGSIENHQTLVVIDNSRPEDPVLYFYDPKGTKPNEYQNDAMAPDQTIPERLETIQSQFAAKLGKPIRFEQFRANDRDQSRFNGTNCAYFCAEAAMHITSDGHSEFSRAPKQIVQKICEEIEQAFPEDPQ